MKQAVLNSYHLSSSCQNLQLKAGYSCLVSTVTTFATVFAFVKEEFDWVSMIATLVIKHWWFAVAYNMEVSIQLGFFSRKTSVSVWPAISKLLEYDFPEDGNWQTDLVHASCDEFANASRYRQWKVGSTKTVTKTSTWSHHQSSSYIKSSSDASIPLLVSVFFHLFVKLTDRKAV